MNVFKRAALAAALSVVFDGANMWATIGTGAAKL
jgi:hypothetical protein